MKTEQWKQGVGVVKEGAVSKESRQILKSESGRVLLEKARKNIAHSHLG